MSKQKQGYETGEIYEDAMEKDFEKVIEEVGEEDAPRLSDYEFDENGYSNEFLMDVGYIDENGETHKSYVFRKLYGSVEEELGKPAYRNNGGKLINEYLAQLLVRIGSIKKKDVGPKEWGNIIRNLYTGDQDIIMLRLREALLGDEIEVNHKCPFEDCEHDLHTFISTSEIGNVFLTV
jgi:hypothetical protein